MDLIRSLLALMLMMLLPFPAAAFTIASCNLPNQNVPFENVVMNAGCVQTVSYSFGNYPIIFCFSNGTETTVSINWPFKGNNQSGNLPITLVTNGNYQGQFADSNGNITIQNTTNSQIVVSCVYGF